MKYMIQKKKNTNKYNFIRIFFRNMHSTKDFTFMCTGKTDELYCSYSSSHI